MKQIVNKYESTYVSKWYEDVNFNNIQELYVGQYEPSITREDNYEILIKFNLEFLAHKLYSLERAVLKLFYLRRENEYSNYISIYKNYEDFKGDNVTWRNRPKHYEEGIEFKIDNTINNRYINIDITDIVKQWAYGIQPNYGITIMSHINVGNSIIYFSKDVSLELEYTPIEEVFGYFQSKPLENIGIGDVINPGELYQGDNIETAQSKDDKPVIQCLLPGVYSITCIGNQPIVGENFGNLTFKIGNKDENIEEFKKINTMPFIGGRQLNSNAMFYVNAKRNQVALVSDTGTANGAYTNTIIQRKTLADNINLYPDNKENIFSGGYLGNLNIKLNVDSDNGGRIFGCDTQTVFKGKLEIEGDLGNNNTITLKNITIYGALNINTTNGTVILENVDVKNVNIISNNINGLKIINGCNIVNINDRSIGITHLKVSSSAKDINIKNIFLSPIGTFNESHIILEGNFGDTNIEVLKALKLESRGVITQRPIIIDIEDGNELKVDLIGNFDNSLIKVVNESLITVTQSILKTSSLSGAEIIVDTNNINEVVQFEGNLKDTIININSIGNVNFKENTIIGELKVNNTCENAIISVGNNTIINNFKVESKVVLSGDINSVKSILAIAIITKNTGNITLNLGENEDRTLEELLGVSTKLQEVFIREINGNIPYKYIEDKVKEVDENVSVTINSVTNVVLDSGAFVLDEAGKTINYTEQVANKDNLNLSFGILNVGLSKNGQNLSKDILLKGKYLDMSIDYNTGTSNIYNKINVFEYAIANKDISNINLMENIIFDNYNLKINSRTLNVNLNTHSLTTDSIWLQDGEINIENGLINVNENIEKWNKYSNILSFITIVKNNFNTVVNFSNLTIRANNIVANSNTDSSTKVTLISTINDDVNLNNNVNELNLYNSTLQVDKNDVSSVNNVNVYGINTSCINNFMYNCTLKGYFNGIRIQNNLKKIYMSNVLSKNNFEIENKSGFKTIEIVPYTGSNGVINGANVISNEMEEEVLLNIKDICNSLIETRGYVEENTFVDGSRATLSSDKTGKMVKQLIYVSSLNQWVESGELVAPIVNPDTTNNDMMNNITLTFTPNVKWANNIQEITVKNTKQLKLTSNEYSIDSEKGEVTIFNIKVNDKGVPVYQGILEPSNNYIYISATGYNLVTVNQFIKSIQIVEMKNGEGKAITRIKGEGNKDLKGYVISGDNNYKIGEDKPITIL